MLAYILEITKQGNSSVTNRSKFYGLQIESRGITNRSSIRDFESGQKDNKSGQEFRIGAREITNRGDVNLEQGLKIGSKVNTNSEESTQQVKYP